MNRKFAFLAFSIFSINTGAYAKELITNVDMNGDGTLDPVYRDGYYLSVESTVSPQRYQIGPDWKLAYDSKSSFVDVDGTAGAEAILIAGSELVVISHKKQRIQRELISYSSWVPVNKGIAEMNGKPGSEIITISGPDLIVVSVVPTSQSFSLEKDSFWISDGNWAVVPDAITDIDNVSGSELIVIHENNVDVIFLAKTSNRKREFTIATGSAPWQVLTQGIRDLDGVAGKEIPVKTGDYLKVIHAMDSKINSHFVSNDAWNATNYGNFDQYPGDEIIVTLKNGSQKTISDRDNSIPVPGQSCTPAPLYQYVNHNSGISHFNRSLMSSVQAKDSSGNTLTIPYVGQFGNICTKQASGTSPLYEYYSSALTDYYYTTDYVTTNPYGYVSRGIIGYVYTNSASGRVKMCRYLSTYLTEHAYLPSTNTCPDASAYGFAFERVEGYVLP